MPPKKPKHARRWTFALFWAWLIYRITHRGNVAPVMVALQARLK